MDTNTKPRTLVLCFDGTSDKYGSTNTNIVKLFALLKKDGIEHLTFYQAGAGTWFQPGVVSPMFEWGAKMLDEAFAWYLGAHVIEGYSYLMDNYRKGDKICIFGFSRGAYTARALAGFLYKVGLLPRGNQSQVSFAYKMYKRRDAKGIKLCAGFKQTYCRSVTIEFMGVWDTVSSVGAFYTPALPFTSSNSAIKTFRHALSLDECRTKFRPNYYHHTPPGVAQPDPEPSNSVKASSSNPSMISHSKQGPSGVEKKDKSAAQTTQVKERLNSEAVEIGKLDVKEVWFAGWHTDVGGSAVSNNVEHSLADISLRWMVREIAASGFGTIFDASALARAKISLDPEPTEIEMDALDPLYNQLRITFVWWLLEILPFPYSYQDANNVWHTSYVPNMGRGRRIVDPHPTMHITVKKRIESQLKYKPNARWTPNSEVYVD